MTCLSVRWQLASVQIQFAIDHIPAGLVTECLPSVSSQSAGVSVSLILPATYANVN